MNKLVVFEIDDETDINIFLGKLKPEVTESLEAWMVCYSGYDYDPRELWDIGTVPERIIKTVGCLLTAGMPREKMHPSTLALLNKCQEKIEKT